MRQEETSPECVSCQVSRRTFIAEAGSVAALAFAPSLLEVIDHVSLSPSSQPRASLGPGTDETVSSPFHCSAVFAPSENLVKAVEQPYRQEICLNGTWQFQPMSLPERFVEGEDPAPNMPYRQPNQWTEDAILITSPHILNTF